MGARVLRNSDMQVELPVRARKVAVLEEEELDFPEARVVDLERVGPGPVPAVGQGDVERGPGRAVDLDGLVVSRRGVVDDPNADEVDADRVVDARGLVARDAYDHGPGLRDVQGRWVF